jgi:serine/threonine protein kinase
MPERGSIRPEALTPAAAALILQGDTHEEGTSDTPQVIAGYNITKELGRGGGGAVYLAHRARSDRLVALKVMTARLGRDDQHAARTFRELGILQQLHLTALPRVLDYGEHNGHLYIATEYIEGLPLDRHCDENKLDRRARVRLIARVAEAVQSLHEHGVIHRDIKPSNILIDAHGDPVIIDLGIATLQAVDGMETLTADGAAIGTPAFMSPEQARGERQRISTRSDVYGLGATAFLVLTGKTPHDSTSTIHEMVRRVAQDPPRRARDLDPTLPKALAAVLEKAVSPSTEYRYTSAADFAADLGRWLNGDKVLAGGHSRWSAATNWVSRHPALTSTFASMAIAAIIIGSSWFTRRALELSPATIVTSPNMQSASLVSLTGRRLYEWTANHTDVHFARLLDRDSTVAASRLAATIIHTSPSDPFSNQLCIWRVDDLIRGNIKPLWHTEPGPPYLSPPFEGTRLARPYHAFPGLEADIFPECPGQELVILHNHVVSSARGLRIYSFTGDVLWEMWHDGDLWSPVWLNERRILVLAGTSKTCAWQAFRGAPPLPKGANTGIPVVMAFRPQLGERLGWVNRAPDSLKAATWYRALLIEGPAWGYQTKVRLHRDLGHSGVELELGITHDPPIAQVGLSIPMDGDGNLVSNGTIFKGELNDDHPDLDPARFSLGDLPWPAPTTAP